MRLKISKKFLDLALLWSIKLEACKQAVFTRLVGALSAADLTYVSGGGERDEDDAMPGLARSDIQRFEQQPQLPNLQRHEIHI